jgi:hypothetical protein
VDVTTTDTGPSVQVDNGENIEPTKRAIVPLRQTATDMLTHLQDKATSPIPSLTYGSNITNAYIQIAQILKRAMAPPKPTPLPPAPEERVPSPTITPPAPKDR